MGRQSGDPCQTMSDCDRRVVRLGERVEWTHVDRSAGTEEQKMGTVQRIWIQGRHRTWCDVVDDAGRRFNTMARNCRRIPEATP